MLSNTIEPLLYISELHCSLRNYICLSSVENASYKKQNTLARLYEPRIKRLIMRGIAKVEKQSLQLVNVEIASPAATYIKYNLLAGSQIRAKVLMIFDFCDN